MKYNKGAQSKVRERHAKKGRHAVRAVALKMKVKKGDKVVVMSGKDKGKSGEVVSVFPRENKVVVDGIALAKRHLRSTGGNQSGRIVERPMPIHASNVMVLDPETKKGTRIGRVAQDGKNVRMAKKSKTVIK
jgi:large subunit ribosomal protein L24